MIIRNVVSALLAGLIASIAASQPPDTLWTMTYGGTETDYGYSVQQTSDSGFIICGNSNSFGTGMSHDIYLIKTDESGNQVWMRTFGGTGYDQGRSVQQTSDGGYIITGRIWPSGASDAEICLIKTNSLGIEEWTEIYGGETGNSCSKF